MRSIQKHRVGDASTASEHGADHTATEANETEPLLEGGYDTTYDLEPVEHTYVNDTELLHIINLLCTHRDPRTHYILYATKFVVASIVS